MEIATQKDSSANSGALIRLRMPRVKYQRTYPPSGAASPANSTDSQLYRRLSAISLIIAAVILFIIVAVRRDSS